QTWYPVLKKGLSAADKTDLRKLAMDSVRVHLAESGDDSRPTVIVEDWGIGQHPSNFPSTLLSLHQSIKREKPYLIGRYGQGGATALAHSDYTIVVSRRAPTLDESPDDLVGFTVVRYKPHRLKGGTYEYLCGPSNKIMAVKASDAPARFQEQHGTR